MSANVLGLCEVGEFEAQMFILAQMIVRIPMLKCSTYAPILQNPCWWLGLFLKFFFKIQ